jgi:hypothetical protein
MALSWFMDRRCSRPSISLAGVARVELKRPSKLGIQSPAA